MFFTALKYDTREKQNLLHLPHFLIYFILVLRKSANILLIFSPEAAFTLPFFRLSPKNRRRSSNATVIKTINLQLDDFQNLRKVTHSKAVPIFFTFTRAINRNP